MTVDYDGIEMEWSDDEWARIQECKKHPREIRNSNFPSIRKPDPLADLCADLWSCESSNEPKTRPSDVKHDLKYWLMQHY